MNEMVWGFVPFLLIYSIRQYVTTVVLRRSHRILLEDPRGKVTVLLLWLVYIPLLVGALYRGVSDEWGASSYWSYSLLLIGALLRCFALRAIQGFYSPGIAILESHQVVRSGPYRVLRHPLTTGLTLEMLGLCLFTGASWASVVFLIAFLVVQAHNRREEIVLTKHLGTDYRHFLLDTLDIRDLVFTVSKSGGAADIVAKSARG
jgi:protein-S-isoprenylcysteine O-methyltransferase Ste14